MTARTYTAGAEDLAFDLVRELLRTERDLVVRASELIVQPNGRGWIRVADTADADAWLIAWGPASSVGTHDHGGSQGAAHVLRGALVERYWDRDDPSPRVRRLAARSDRVCPVRPRARRRKCRRAAGTQPACIFAPAHRYGFLPTGVAVTGPMPQPDDKETTPTELTEPEGLLAAYAVSNFDTPTVQLAEIVDRLRELDSPRWLLENIRPRCRSLDCLRRRSRRCDRALRRDPRALAAPDRRPRSRAAACGGSHRLRRCRSGQHRRVLPLSAFPPARSRVDARSCELGNRGGAQHLAGDIAQAAL